MKNSSQRSVRTRRFYLYLLTMDPFGYAQDKFFGFFVDGIIVLTLE